MIEGSYYRQKAADCRRIANASKRPELYLLALAEHFDRVAQATEGAAQSRSIPPAGLARQKLR